MKNTALEVLSYNALMLSIDFYVKLKEQKLRRSIIVFIFGFLLFGFWFSQQLLQNRIPGFENIFQEFQTDLREQMDTSQNPDLKNLNDEELQSLFATAGMIAIPPTYTLMRFLSLSFDILLIYWIMSFFKKTSFKYLLKIGIYVSIIAEFIQRVSLSFYQYDYPIYFVSFWVIFFYIVWAIKSREEINS